MLEHAVCETGCQHIGIQCCSPLGAYMTLFSVAAIDDEAGGP